MTGEHYLLLGFIGGLGVLWGYAIDLWITSWALRRREHTMNPGKPANGKGAHSMTHTLRVLLAVVAVGFLAGSGSQPPATQPQDLPPGHPPPTPQLPAGHPPMTPQLPSGHPPLGTTGPRGAAQPQTVIPDPADVATVDAIVASYYASISGRRDVPRDWNRFRSLFMPNARLVTMRAGGASLPIVMSVEDYVAGSDAYYRKSGYHEAEVYRQERVFGGMGHVMSTFASRRGTAEADPYARGINSIQLLSDGSRWWIVTIMWEHERVDRPLPPEFLPGEEDRKE